MSAVQSRTPRRLRAAAAAAALLGLAGCPAAPVSGPSGTPSGTASPTMGTPTAVYTDQQLADIATAVVRSRGILGAVREPRSLRGNPTLAGTSVTSVTTPAECSPFRLQDGTERELRYLDRSAGIAAGELPLAPPGGPTVTMAFTIRSAARDKLALADFNYPDSLAARCSRFRRTYTEVRAGHGAPGTTYSAQLVPGPAVGEKSYRTTQKADGLGSEDMGVGGMQVLSGTIALDLTARIWPVDAPTTARTMDALAGFARDIIGEAVKSSGQQTVPAGAMSPVQLAALLANLTGPGGRKLFLSPADARAVTTTTITAASPVPAAARCSFDDAAYYTALAGRATMAHGIGSTDDKAIMFDVTVVSTGADLKQPYPFDTRAAAVANCRSIQANIEGEGPLSWPSTVPVPAKLRADSSYAFTYSLPGGQLHSYVRLGARMGPLSVEVATFPARPLSDAKVQPAVEMATAIIEQTFAKAGLRPAS